MTRQQQLKMLRDARATIGVLLSQCVAEESEYWQALSDAMHGIDRAVYLAEEIEE